MNTMALDRTLAEPRGGYLITRDGAQLRLRSVTSNDGKLLADFLADLSPEDMRFRFLDARRTASSEDIARMIEVDHRHTEHVLVSIPPAEPW